MRRLSIFLLLALFAACSKDEEKEPVDNSEVNPESWTQLKGSDET